MKRVIDLTQRLKEGGFEVSFEGVLIEIELDPPMLPLAEAMAADVRLSIQGQPGGKWNRTGTLLRGIVAEAVGADAVVVAPADRLERPDTLEEFVRDVMRPDPFQAEVVDRALDATLLGMIEVKQ